MQVFPFDNPKTLIIILVVITLWTIPFKAMALWKSARQGQIGWFIFFVLINTAGLMEIIYLYYLSKVKVKNIDYNPVRNQKQNYMEKRRII